MHHQSRWGFVLHHQSLIWAYTTTTTSASNTAVHCASPQTCAQQEPVLSLDNQQTVYMSANKKQQLLPYPWV